MELDKNTQTGYCCRRRQIRLADIPGELMNRKSALRIEEVAVDLDTRREILNFKRIFSSNKRSKLLSNSLIGPKRGHLPPLRDPGMSAWESLMINSQPPRGEFQPVPSSHSQSAQGPFSGPVRLWSAFLFLPAYLLRDSHCPIVHPSATPSLGPQPGAKRSLASGDHIVHVWSSLTSHFDMPLKSQRGRLRNVLRIDTRSFHE
jgi:hypothetical protein